MSGTLSEVGTVEGGGMHIYEHLVRPVFRRCDLLPGERMAFLRGLNDYGFHRPSMAKKRPEVSCCPVEKLHIRHFKRRMTLHAFNSEMK